jgi:radical SAM protein with 4Fe4S-binding SPASM domain
MFISHTGEVFPSGFLPVSAGNIAFRSPVEIYRNAPLFRQLRDRSLLKGKCGTCSYRQVCGGSRARAYAMTGDWLEAEPFCIHEG